MPVYGGAQLLQLLCFLLSDQNASIQACSWLLRKQSVDIKNECSTCYRGGYLLKFLIIDVKCYHKQGLKQPNVFYYSSLGQ